MLDLNKTYTADELCRMQDETKSTEAGTDLALKDATHIYYNGANAGEHTSRPVGRLRHLRSLNSDLRAVEHVWTTNIPQGGMVYMAGDRVFAFEIEPRDIP